MDATILNSDELASAKRLWVLIEDKDNDQIGRVLHTQRKELVKELTKMKCRLHLFEGSMKSLKFNEGGDVYGRGHLFFCGG